jgi:PAS domain S-box-containing protein
VALYLSRVHPDDVERVRGAIDKTLQHGGDHRVDYRIVLADGSVRWLASRGQILKDADGQPVTLIGVLTDVTARKQTEQAFEEMQHFNDLITRTLPDFIYVYDLGEQRQVYINRPLPVYLGYTPDGLPGWESSASPLIQHPDDTPIFERMVQALHTLRDGEFHESEYRFRHADGSWRWFYSREMVILRHDDGRPRQYLGLAQDITARKQTEDKLRQSETRLRTVIANLPVILFTTDANGIFTLLDGKAVDVLGMKREQVIGFSAYALNRDVPDALENFRRVLEYGESVHSYRTFGEHTLESWASPLRDEQGHITGLLGISVDITERAQIEAERARLLEREQAARAEAEKANQLKTQFVGMISHELRTPLTPIKGFVTTLLDDELGLDPATRRKFLSLIDQETDRLVGLVDHLLDVTRIQAGMLRVNLYPSTLDQIVANAYPQLASLASGHLLLLELPTMLPSVLADSDRVVQVLVNLVSNAAKYAPPLTTVSVTASQQGDWVQIDVLDEGEGIAPEQRDKVFEPFFQLERGGQRRGAGLGLAICKGIVEAHGGSIWIEANQPQGTRVCFTLRCAN